MIIKFKFDKHLEVKDKLLNLINDAPFTKINNDMDNINKTDFYISGLEKDYVDYVKPKIVNFLYKCFESYNIGGFELGYMWFQQYSKNNTHKWHTHKNTNFACVYFLEMPDSSQKTLIKNFGSDDLIKYEAEEGDIIIFPGYLSHSSPLINTDSRKTIISFNISIIGK